MTGSVIRQRINVSNELIDYKALAAFLASAFEYIDYFDDLIYENNLDRAALPANVKISIKFILNDLPQNIKDELNFEVIKKYFALDYLSYGN